MEEGLACQSLAIRERMWLGSRSAKGGTLVRKSVSRLLGRLLGSGWKVAPAHFILMGEAWSGLSPAPTLLILSFLSLKDGGCTCPGDVAKAFGKCQGQPCYWRKKGRRGSGQPGRTRWKREPLRGFWAYWEFSLPGFHSHLTKSWLSFGSGL